LLIYSFPTPVAPRRGSLIRRFPEVLPPFAAAAAVLLAALSLVGWHFRIPQLREPMGGFMAPNAALCFMRLSTAIITLRWRERRWA
jgi:hypothetical protein